MRETMNTDEILLMTPGPTEVSIRVLKAMMRPAIHHYDPNFMEVFDETTQLLKKIFQTKNNVVMLCGTGRTGMEASVLSLIEPGDKVLNIVSGVFSEWFKNICEIYGAQSVNLEFEWGKPIDLEKVKETLEKEEDIKILTAVHNETSTGAVNPIKELGKLAKKYGALFVVDAISSLGGIEIKVDEWNIDVCVSSSQKCLGGLYGISVLSISDAAWEAMENREIKPRSYAYDLLKWKLRWIPKEEGGLLVLGRRSYPLPPPTHLVYALNEACKIILEEGLDKRFKRHRIIAYATREGVKSIGLKIFPDEEIASSTVTVINVPDGLSDADIVDRMLREYKIMIAKGLRKLNGKVIRIGHMANTANRNHIIPTLAALEDVLYKFGIVSERGVAVETALNIIEKQLEN